MTLGFVLVLVPLAVLAYAYVLYPALLWCLARFSGERLAPPAFADWPAITITLPVHNEEQILRGTLEHVLSLDYPADRRHVLVISDASTDGTDAIASEFRDRGVELIRLPSRA